MSSSAENTRARHPKPLAGADKPPQNWPHRALEARPDTPLVAAEANSAPRHRAGQPAAAPHSCRDIQTAAAPSPPPSSQPAHSPRAAPLVHCHCAACAAAARAAPAVPTPPRSRSQKPVHARLSASRRRCSTPSSTGQRPALMCKDSKVSTSPHWTSSGQRSSGQQLPGAPPDDAQRAHTQPRWSASGRTSAPTRPSPSQYNRSGAQD